MSINAFQGFDQEEERLERDAAGLFGDDDDDDDDDDVNENGRRGQYGDDGDDEDVDDILGLDDGGNGNGEEAAGGGAEVDDERGLLMRFCPHDSSMLYPKVSCRFARQKKNPFLFFFCFGRRGGRWDSRFDDAIVRHRDETHDERSSWDDRHGAMVRPCFAHHSGAISLPFVPPPDPTTHNSELNITI